MIMFSTRFADSEEMISNAMFSVSFESGRLYTYLPGKGNLPEPKNPIESLSTQRRRSSTQILQEALDPLADPPCA